MTWIVGMQKTDFFATISTGDCRMNVLIKFVEKLLPFYLTDEELSTDEMVILAVDIIDAMLEELKKDPLVIRIVY